MMGRPRVWSHRSQMSDYQKDVFTSEAGYYPPSISSIGQIVDGRRFPIGMKFVINDAYLRNGKPVIVFYDEGFKKVSVDAKNVKVVVERYDRLAYPEEYRNVHEVTVYD